MTGGRTRSEWISACIRDTEPPVSSRTDPTVATRRATPPLACKVAGKVDSPHHRHDHAAADLHGLLGRGAAERDQRAMDRIGGHAGRAEPRTGWGRQSKPLKSTPFTRGIADALLASAPRGRSPPPRLARSLPRGCRVRQPTAGRFVPPLRLPAVGRSALHPIGGTLQPTLQWPCPHAPGGRRGSGKLGRYGEASRRLRADATPGRLPAAHYAPLTPLGCRRRRWR